MTSRSSQGPRALLAFIASLAAACSSGGERSAARQPRSPAPSAEPAGLSLAADAGVLLDEVTARAALFDAFADKGYRLRFDVPIELAPGLTVTLDGYDPDRRVGYEYVAAEELGLELTAAAIAAAPTGVPAVLLIGPADEATVLRAIEAFLARPDLPAGRGMSAIDAGVEPPATADDDRAGPVNR